MEAESSSFKQKETYGGEKNYLHNRNLYKLARNHPIDLKLPLFSPRPTISIVM